MQQRRLRLGDILDDYCPRERRVTNHVVVALIDDEVKQTRCTTCDADHQYKEAKVPPPRRKRTDGAPGEGEGTLRTRPASEDASLPEETPDVDSAEPFAAPTLPGLPESDVEPVTAAGADDDGPVHRRLIRATLPRPDGQAPERKSPDFTIRQPGGRGGREFDGNKNGQRHGHRPMRAQGGAQPPRFGGPRQGSGGSRPGSPQGQRSPGNRPGHPGGPRGNRPGQGSGRSSGRKRGR